MGEHKTSPRRKTAAALSAVGVLSVLAVSACAAGPQEPEKVPWDQAQIEFDEKLDEGLVLHQLQGVGDQFFTLTPEDITDAGVDGNDKARQIMVWMACDGEGIAKFTTDPTDEGGGGTGATIGCGTGPFGVAFAEFLHDDEGNVTNWESEHEFSITVGDGVNIRAALLQL